MNFNITNNNMDFILDNQLHNKSKETNQKPAGDFLIDHLNVREKRRKHNVPIKKTSFACSNRNACHL